MRFGLPSPVPSIEDDDGSKTETHSVLLMTLNDPRGLLPTPEASPRKSSVELSRGEGSLSRGSPELLSTSLTSSREAPAGSFLVGSRPRPVSTSSALSTTSGSPSSNDSHAQRPPASPTPSIVGPSPSPSSSSSTFLPPGAARPRIPGAPLPYEGLPQSLVPGGVVGRPTNAQHGRYTSVTGTSKTALPAPVFRQPASTNVVNSSEVAPKVAQAHHQSASVSHITAALVSGPLEVARTTASAASGHKHLPNLLVSGRGRVATPRGPRGWRLKS